MLYLSFLYKQKTLKTSRKKKGKQKFFFLTKKNKKKQDDSGRCSIMACCIEVEKEFMNVLYNSLWVDFVFYFFIWKFVFLSGFSYLFLNSCLKLLLQINSHTFYLSWKFRFFCYTFLSVYILELFIRFFSCMKSKKACWT